VSGNLEILFMKNLLAFPMTWVKKEAPNLNVILEQRGMTLRDYFAAKAMQGLFASERHTDSNDDFFSCSNDWYSEAAGHAYQMADAMLKAREA
jgi:hypothetical protein